MVHLIVSREYPPAPYAHGGIGTYVQQMARLLAERGETVHVIAEQWDRAPQAVERLCGGRLIVHRVPLARPRRLEPGERHPADLEETLEAMARSEFPAQGFSWQAALLAERLIDTAGIDVIEGQDYEAPLYYLMLRRAAGLAPSRRPPCVVHLHGPWELVCRSNEWGLATPYDRTVARLEAHTIRAADALLCPSDYLARQASALYGVGRETVERIRYPIGDVPLLVRSADVWERGTILYVGRMEPRKGVLEWIDAAVALATERPHLRFEFVGADTTLTGQDGGPSVRAAVAARVPPGLVESFAFHDAEPRPPLWARLARAQLVVVPSRWDNLPNTGLEAMAAGLPVLTSPESGLTEIIGDGRTGWIAASQRPDDLLSALRRALETPANVRAQMGAAAADDIRRVCGDEDVIARHLEFRRRVASAGAIRSPKVSRAGSADVPATGSGRRHVTSADEAAVRASAPSGAGIAVILVDEGDLDGCQHSLAAQSLPPVSVTRVSGSEGVFGPVRALWQNPDARGVALIDSGWRLAPEFLAVCDRMLERYPQVGLVSAWFSPDARRRGPEIRPVPAWPYQWTGDDASPCSVLRVSALRTSGWAHEALEGELVVADLALAIVAGGWDALTYPAHLSWRAHERSAGTIARRAEASARRRLHWAEAEWPGLSSEQREALQALLRVAANRGPEHQSSIRGAWTPRAALRQPLDVQLRLVGRALRNPRYAAGWIGWHARRAWRDLRRRLAGTRPD